jgi:hypothetical protein
MPWIAWMEEGPGSALPEKVSWLEGTLHYANQVRPGPAGDQTNK